MTEILTFGTHLKLMSDSAGKGLISNLLKGGLRYLNPSSQKNNPARPSRLDAIYLKHTAVGKKKYYKLLGKKIAFINGHELLHGIREIFVDEIYKLKLPDNALVIDCGANIGLSVIYLKLQTPTARVIAYEPDENNFQLINENIKAFGFDKVTLKKEAVWNKNETLYFKNTGSQSSKIENEQTDETVAVKASRLKDVITEKVGFLKIDIEGAEYQVLVDIADKLNMVDSMFVEYHGKYSQANELVEIFNIIRNAGFSIYIKEAANVYPTPLLKTNQDMMYDVQLNIFCIRN
ncbi:MAG: FkbM family methyltransferase [Bacteroidetes bacterium]|nr:FkbM family methyltransferase [Bacteroidota bacterium]